MNTILAHLTIDNREQTLAQHAKGTAELREEFAAVFGAGPYAREMALAHDAGKQADAFQRYLRRAAQNPRQKMHGPDHSTAGAQFLMRAGMAHAALCVAGHHAGLPDVGNRRSPHGERGLKLYRESISLTPYKSLPARGAWIEIVYLKSCFS